MNSDSIFLIGDSHKICQDYALNKDTIGTDISCAIISDGCSGSPNTDIGARLIALASLQSTQLPTVIEKAEKIAKSLNIFNMCLDATLLRISAFKNKNSTDVQVDIAGDGYIAFKQQNQLIIFEATAPNGYPFYLSYLLEDRLKNSYAESNGNPSIIYHEFIYDTETKIWKEKLEEQTKISDNLYYKISRDFTKDTTVAVFSDGVSSFSTEDGEEVSPFEIIQMFMDFKSTKGKFVERRVNSVLKKLKKQKWSHYDDISMSAIHIEGSNETENKKQW